MWCQIHDSTRIDETQRDITSEIEQRTGSGLGSRRL